MTSHVAELQAAVANQTLPWVVVGNGRATAAGTQEGVGYVLKAWRIPGAWQWSVGANRGVRTGRSATAREALDAANAEYSRFASDVHRGVA
jgi:hypothetical protein